MLETIIFLKKSPLFATMKTSELRQVAQIAGQLDFEPQDTIVAENDIGDSMYLVKDGRVLISKAAGIAGRIELAELSAGDCFGDMALFDAEVRSATVTARTRCSVLRIGGADMLDVLSDNPAIAIELIRIFVKRLREANRRIEFLSLKAGAPPAAGAGEAAAAGGK
jgi:CRP-like cAMP-binding protein